MEIFINLDWEFRYTMEDCFVKHIDGLRYGPHRDAAFVRRDVLAFLNDIFFSCVCKNLHN